ncbi:MAG: thiamine pyrophosphate-dependent enzyme, partial [Actinomycetota bacterium]
VVFMCQNNGWAISLPRSEQTASDTIAEKAIAYGMPGVQVDGNDLFAVYETTREAADRARAGEGPTLIEAVTYRLGPHTTSDDPTRYREDTERSEWERRDPLERVRIFLSERDAWDDEWQEAIQAEATTEIDRAIDLAEKMPPMERGKILDAMFETLPPHLKRQRAELTESGT